jgi:hypothetical protein
MAALERLRKAREVGALSYTGLIALAAASARLRAPLLGALFVVGSTWSFRRLFPRQGVRLNQFAVYGSSDRSVAAVFEDALLDYSNLVRRVYNSRHIQLFFDDLKGAAVAEAGAIEQALAEARDLDVKAVVGLALGQGVRFLRELPERPRLLISGAVRLLPGSAKATAIIRDLATTTEAYLEASSADIGALPMLGFIERKLLAPATAATSSWQRGEDLRRVSGQLQAVALVLACKIRLHESQAVRTGLRPSHWETICLTTAAMKDLAMMSSESDYTGLVDALSCATELDPLYRPASFLLGYAHVARGDSANARRVFEPLREALDDATKRAAADLRQHVIRASPRFTRLAGRIPSIRKWLEYYKSAVSLAIGGDLRVAADTWRTYQRSSDSDVTGESALRLIVAGTHNEELVYAAVNKRPSKRYTTERARKLLDDLLNDSAITAFDSNLDRLDVLCIVASIGVPPEPEHARAMDALREQGLLSDFFKGEIDRLRQAFTNREWEKSRDIIEELRWYTRDASEYRFAALLDDASVEGYRAKIAGWFVPFLRYLREQRLAVREPLFLETEYHLALAELISFEPALLIKAWERAKQLRENRFPRSSSRGAERDLELLTGCIEVNALAVLISQIGADVPVDYVSLIGLPESDKPGLKLFTAKNYWERRFAEVSQDRQISPVVRSAVATARGMLARYDRLHRTQYLEKHRRERPSYEASERELIYGEMGYYNESLDLHPTSAAHCHLAECLIELGMKGAALAHVKRALALAPMYSLALRLTAQLQVTEAS